MLIFKMILKDSQEIIANKILRGRQVSASPEYGDISKLSFAKLQKFAWRSRVRCPAVIMASGTIGLNIKFAIFMTITAIKFNMNFIQLQAGYRMLEIFAVPTAMASVTIGIEFCHHLPCRMAGATG
jgi:hypothetical protein